MGVGVVIHGYGGGEWEDDMMREENNFKLNSLANKTFEKLTMGVVNCPPSFSIEATGGRHGYLIHGGGQWQKMAG